MGASKKKKKNISIETVFHLPKNSARDMYRNCRVLNSDQCNDSYLTSSSLLETNSQDCRTFLSGKCEKEEDPTN